jgi:hypothetical protein
MQNERGPSATNERPSQFTSITPSLGNSRISQDGRFVALNWKPYEKNTLRGFCDISLPSGLIITGCSLHEQDGKRWVALPARPYQKSDGTTNYVNILDFTNAAAKSRFQASALRAVDALQEVQS